jgi:hypothetical protein
VQHIHVMRRIAFVSLVLIACAHDARVGPTTSDRDLDLAGTSLDPSGEERGEEASEETGEEAGEEPRVIAVPPPSSPVLGPALPARSGATETAGAAPAASIGVPDYGLPGVATGAPGTTGTGGTATTGPATTVPASTAPANDRNDRR